MAREAKTSDSLSRMDELTLEPATRPGGGGPGPTKREAKYLRFLINGEALDRMVNEGDYATPLQPGSGSWHESRVAMLAGEIPGELPSGRVPLLICPECGDVGCGAVGAFIEIGSGTVVWSGFAYENNYEPAHTANYKIGPFEFESEHYLRAIRNAPNHWVR